MWIHRLKASSYYYSTQHNFRVKSEILDIFCCVFIQFYRDFRFYISRNASHKPRKCLLSIVAPTKNVHDTKNVYFSAIKLAELDFIVMESGAWTITCFLLLQIWIPVPGATGTISYLNLIFLSHVSI